MVVAQHDLEVLGLIPQHFRKQDVVAQACNLSTRKVQTGKPEIQGYSWLQKQVQAQPELMKTKKDKQKEFAWAKLLCIYLVTNTNQTLRESVAKEVCG